jgi:hypothetical protein
MLDRETCDIAPESVGEAIAAGAALARDRGRLVVEVYVDGERWSDECFDQPQRLGANAHEVALVSAHAGEMVRQTILDAAEALDDIEALQREAAGLIQSGAMAGAMERLGSALELWTMVQRAAGTGSQLAGVPLDHVRTAGSTMSEGIASLNARLESMRESLSNRDPVALSDTLLYDLPEVVQTWRGLLRALAELVARADVGEDAHDASGQRPADR